MKPIFARRRLFDMGARPLLWKEMCIERGMSFNRTGRILGLLFILSSFLPVVLMISGAIYEFVIYHTPFHYIWHFLGIKRQCVVGVVGTSVACLTLLAIAVVRTRINEHERLTFDKPGEHACAVAEYALNAKWLGSIWSVRWGVAWLASVWCVGVLLGGLNLFTVPWLILSWTVYAAFCASLGLACSVHLRASLSATVRVLLIAAMTTIGHLLPWMIIGWPRLPQVYFSALLLAWREFTCCRFMAWRRLSPSDGFPSVAPPSISLPIRMRLHGRSSSRSLKDWCCGRSSRFYFGNMHAGGWRWSEGGWLQVVQRSGATYYCQADSSSSAGLSVDTGCDLSWLLCLLFDGLCLCPRISCLQWNPSAHPVCHAVAWSGELSHAYQFLGNGRARSPDRSVGQ